MRKRVKVIEEPLLFDLLHTPSHVFKIEGAMSFTLQGHSRAGERTGYWVKELDLHLDAGVGSSKSPSTLFLTHCHPDHCTALPLLIFKASKRVKLFLPETAVPLISSLLGVYTRLYAGDDDAVADIDQLCTFLPIQHLDVPRVYRAREDAVNPPRYAPPEEGPWMRFEAERIKLKGQNCLLRFCRCDHRVDSVGYGVSLLKTTRKKEYEALDNLQIRDLKRTDPEIEISETKEVGLFLFMGDTTTRVFDDPQAHWIFSHYPVIIIECTFWKEVAGEEEKATERGHIHWNQLKPFVESNPNTTFVLSHHSLSASIGQIVDFFRPLRLSFPNVVLWLEPSPVFLSDLESL